MNRLSRLSLRALVLVGLAASLGLLSVRPALAANPAGCPALDVPNVPSVTLSNGLMSAVVLPPDGEKGFYQGVRFDRSGVVWCLTFKGHNYFGYWFDKATSKMKSPIFGPVEDFRSGDGKSAPGYDQAKPGETFVKPGVGVLRRIDDKPYHFNTDFPVVDPGKWTVRTGKSQIAFRHDLHSAIGIAYVYQKKLKLLPNQPVLAIEHELKNTGTQPMDIQVYNHDFFVIDGTPSGPGMEMRFPFEPKAEKPLGTAAHIEGKKIVFDQLVGGPGQGASGNLTGFSDKASDFDFVLENTKTGVGVEQTATLPIESLLFWSNAQTICPEAYVHIKVAPGQTTRWTIRYRFFAK